MTRLFATHHLCEACWKKREGERKPGRLVDDTPAPCCACGNWTTSGIYLREESATLLCKGIGPNHEGD